MGYKFNIRKSIVFTYKNNNQLEDRMEKNASFTIAIKADKIPWTGLEYSHPKCTNSP
jgi:hypothetical protein